MYKKSITLSFLKIIKKIIMKKIIISFISLAVIVLAAVLVVNHSYSAKNPLLTEITSALADEPTNGTLDDGTSSTHSLSCGKSGIKMCEATCGVHQVTMRNYGDGSPASFTCPN